MNYAIEIKRLREKLTLSQTEIVKELGVFLQPSIDVNSHVKLKNTK